MCVGGGRRQRRPPADERCVCRQGVKLRPGHHEGHKTSTEHSRNILHACMHACKHTRASPARWPRVGAAAAPSACCCRRHHHLRRRTCWPQRRPRAPRAPPPSTCTGTPPAQRASHANEVDCCAQGARGACAYSAVHTPPRQLLIGVHDGLAEFGWFRMDGSARPPMAAVARPATPTYTNRDLAACDGPLHGRDASPAAVPPHLPPSYM